MTPADLRHIVQFLALPEGTKFVAVDADGACFAFTHKPLELETIWRLSIYTRGRIEPICQFKPQPNWRELCISVEGSDEE